MFLVGFLPILLLFSTVTEAAAPAGETWFTLRTPNFRVHHTAPLEPYARHFAFSLERSLPVLEQRLRWKAPTPIDILVMDNSDSANGLAANFPNTRIEVFATPFEHDSPLSHYMDWVDELAIHELTHIIANDTALGYYLTLRSVFGSWVKPNGLQPTWLIEGLGVYQETSLSPGGRGRSPWMEALLREAVRAGTLTDKSYTSLDRFNDGNPWWPGGSTPYLMGYTIQAQGAGALPNFPGEVSYHNAGLMPFMPNRNAEVLLGKNWKDVWNEAPALLQQRYGAAATEQPPPCFLSTSGRQTGGHALSPDGWIYFSEESFERGFRLSRVRSDAPCGNAEAERLYHKEDSGPSQVAVSEDGKLVAFAVFDLARFEHLYSDLYLWNSETEATDQLTHGARARDPAFAGPFLFFIRQNNDTTQSILRLHLENKEEAVLFTSGPMERLSGLHARSDQLVFSRHNNKGEEKIFRLSTEGGRAEHLLPPREHAANRVYERNPHISPDGSVWFASYVDPGPGHYRAETQSIYRFQPGQKEAALVYSASSGFVDRPIPLPGGKELIVQEYSLRGTDIARVALPPLVSAPASLPKDLHEYLTGEPPPAWKAPSAEELASLGPVLPYSAISTTATSLWPQYWLPEIAAAEEGVLIGASTSGNDSLEYHLYSLTAQYDSRAKFPLYRAFYRSRHSTTNFYFEARQTNNYLVSTNTSNRSSSYSAEASIPIGKSFYTFGGAFQERNLFSRKGQNVIVFQNFSYSEVGKTPAAIEPNFGELLQVYVGLYPRARNEDFFVDLRPQTRFYFSGFAPDHSVSVVARAGITTNSLLASNYYLGGGVSVLDASDFVVRGYPVDSLLGQRIGTLNLAYTLPLAQPFRGWRTNPLFLRSLGLRLMADAGSANFLSLYNGNTFLRYQPAKWGKKILTGFGLDLITKGSAFYHIPLSLVTGVHYGSRKAFGGDFVFYLGFSVGQFGSINEKSLP